MLADLLATPGVTERSVLAERVGLLALHGGLEAGTEEVAAAAAAATGASLYAVSQPPDLRWHIPSIRYDPRQSPALRAFLEHVLAAVSIHGFGRRGFEGTVLLGGANRRLAASFARALRRRGLPAIDDLGRIPRGLRGLHAANPVNLPLRAGVQVELSPQVRRGRQRELVVEAVAAVLRSEGRSICAAVS